MASAANGADVDDDGFDADDDRYDTFVLPPDVQRAIDQVRLFHDGTAQRDVCLSRSFQALKTSIALTSIP